MEWKIFFKEWNERYDGEYIDGKLSCKQYKNDKIIFEGKYLNGKRNGKGKEYKDDKLIFEGEYLNGKRNGKGKEYNYLDISKYEIKYIGKRKKKYFNSVYKVSFESEYLNGKRN